jgi:hypothetical protein
MLLRTDGLFYMHDSLSHISMDQEQHHHHDGDSYGSGDWVEISSYSSTQQSPVNEYGSYGYINHVTHGVPMEPTFSRMPPPPTHSTHQQLLPLIMPSHPTWPSMITNPGSYQPQPILPPVVGHSKPPKLPAIHAPSPRKTQTMIGGVCAGITRRILLSSRLK